MPIDRRKFLSGAGAGLLAFQVGDIETLLSPREARALELPLRVLSPDESAALESLGETLVPGASAAGLSHYVDQQLGASPADSLLMIRYLDVPPPYGDFYKPSLASLDLASREASGKPFHALDAAERDEFVRQMQKGNPAGWQAPPAPFVYFVLRADAIDVVYGTETGFAKLGIPYMAHITPPKPW